MNLEQCPVGHRGGKVTNFGLAQYAIPAPPDLPQTPIVYDSSVMAGKFTHEEATEVARLFKNSLAQVDFPSLER